MKQATWDQIARRLRANYGEVSDDYLALMEREFLMVDDEQATETFSRALRTHENLPRLKSLLDVLEVVRRPAPSGPVTHKKCDCGKVLPIDDATHILECPKSGFSKADAAIKHTRVL